MVAVVVFADAACEAALAVVVLPVGVFVVAVLGAVEVVVLLVVAVDEVDLVVVVDVFFVVVGELVVGVVGAGAWVESDWARSIPAVTRLQTKMMIVRFMIHPFNKSRTG